MAHQTAEIRNILCPTDFSDCSNIAVSRAASLAQEAGCRLTLMHVIPFRPPALVVAPGPLGGGLLWTPSDLLAEPREDVEAELARLSGVCARPGLEVTTETGAGEPWREIEGRANSLPADLVVLGTHGRGGWDRFMMGSTTERLIRRLRCPVLAVGPSETPGSAAPFRRILCALDLTAVSGTTLDLAFSFARKSLAAVTLLHVIDGDRQEWIPRDPRHATRDEFLRAAREGAIAEMYRLGKDAPPLCKVDNLATIGTAWREIVRMAEAIKSDLIVVGAHGVGSIGESFLGSVAVQTVRHAPCPVLIARPPRSASDAPQKRARAKGREPVIEAPRLITHARPAGS